jgi:hypothetical protein
MNASSLELKYGDLFKHTEIRGKSYRMTSGRSAEKYLRVSRLYRDETKGTPRNPEHGLYIMRGKKTVVFPLKRRW